MLDKQPGLQPLSQRLKPSFWAAASARLKSCPDTKLTREHLSDRPLLIPMCDYNHSPRRHGDQGEDRAENSVSSALQLFRKLREKRGIVLAQSILQAYLDEMCVRFDNRQNPYLFRDTLLRLLQAEHLEYKQLVNNAA